MVETVSASPLPQASGNGAVAQGLEPGTELKAKVEANLPGGVVRLATADAKLELRVPTPLPEGGEVTVTVSGTKQQPAILITVGKDQAQPQQQPSPAPSSQGQASQGQAAQGQTTNGQASNGQAVQPPSQSDAGASLQPQSSTATAYPRPSPVLAHLVQVVSVNAAPGQAVSTSPPLQQAPAPGAQTPNGVPSSAGGAQQGAAGSAAPAQSAAPTGTGTQTAGNAAPPAGSVSQTSSLVQTATIQPLGAASAPNGAGPVAGQPQAGAAPPTAAQPSGAPATAQPASPATSAAGPVQPGGNIPVPASPGQAATSPSPPQPGQSVAQPAAASSSAGSAIPNQPAPVATAPPAAQAGTSLLGSPSSFAAGRAGPSAQPSAQGSTPATAQTGGGATTGTIPAPAGAVPGAQTSAAGQATAQIPAQGPASVRVSNPSQGIVLPAGQSIPSPASGSQAVPSSASAVATTPSALAASQIGTGTSNQVTGQPGGALLSAGAQPATLTRTATSQPYPAAAGVSVSLTAAAQGQAAVQQPANQIAQMLKQPLSEQQAGLGSLFAQIGSLMSAQGNGNVSLPDPVVKAMQQILGLRLSSAQAPTAQDLQQAVRLSGQFREAQLSMPSAGQGQAALPDLKSALLSFKALLQQLGARSEISHPAGQPPAPSRHGPPQGQAQQTSSGFWAGAAAQNLQALLKETDSALARLRLTQLANTKLSRDDGPRAASRPMDLVVELPLAFGQETAVMQMQVGRDGAGNKGGRRRPGLAPAVCARSDCDGTAGGCYQPARWRHLCQPVG